MKNDVEETKSLARGLRIKFMAQERVLNTLVSQAVDMPKLFWLYPKKRSLRDCFFSPASTIFSNSFMLMVVCPMTLKVVPCGPNGNCLLIDMFGYNIYDVLIWTLST